MSRWISLAGMLVVLVLVFGLDYAAAILRVENARTFNTWWFLWLFDVVELVFAISIVALGWLFISQGAKSAMVSVVALIFGLLLFFSWPLTILFANLGIEFMLAPFDRFLIATPFTYEFHAAALLAVMGAAGLLRNAMGLRAGTRAETVAPNMR